MKKISEIIINRNSLSNDTICQSCTLHTNTENGIVSDINSIVEKYGLDDVDEININSYDLLKRYDYWNSEIFKRELPKLRKVEFAKVSKGTTGWVMVNALLVRGNRTRIEKVNWAELQLSKLVKYTQKTLDAILIHEMIHVFYLCVMKMNINHERPFQNKAKEIGDVVGFTIPITDDITEFKGHSDSLKNVGIFLVEIEGKTTIAIYSLKKFEEIKAIISNYYTSRYGEKAKDIKITSGIGKTILSQKIPIQRGTRNIDRYELSHKYIKDIQWKDGTVREQYLDEM